MRTISYSLLFLIALFGNGSSFAEDLSSNKMEQNNREIYLLSTPRSGTHWCLYCLCYLLDMKTMSNRGPLEVDLLQEFYSGDKPIIYHGHNPKDLWIKKDGDQQDILIVILRNYRECLIRDHGTTKKVLDELQYQAKFNWLDGDKAHALTNFANHYINNLRCYDLWNPATRLLIYYEDLILDPRATLENALDFFHIENKEYLLNKFMDEIDTHKKICLNEYDKRGGSRSKGKDLLYHTKYIGQRNAILIDNTVKSLFPYYFEKYLKRYKLDINQPLTRF